MSKKILSLGLSQSNFLLQLYKEISKLEDGYSFSVDNLKDLSNGKNALDKSFFKNHHDFSGSKLSFSDYLKSLIKIVWLGIFWKFLFFQIRSSRSKSKLIKFLKLQIRTKAIIDTYILPYEYDIYHFHFCIDKNFWFLHYLPKKANVVCSFWGSDLYRRDNCRNNYFVLEGLKRSNFITIQTREMADFLEKKLNYRFGDKLKLAQFAIEKNIYFLINKFQTNLKELDSFKFFHNIPKDNKIVTIGYNANKAFKHIEILKIISEIPKNELQKITFILPLTYSRNSQYLEKLNSFVNELKSMHVIMFNDFLKDEDIAKLRLITDVQIQLPISDALSGTITEVLYANNMVIAGSWLPYEIYEKHGIELIKITNRKDLIKLLPNLLNTLDFFQEDNLVIKNKISDYFFPNYTSKAWIKIYNSLS